MVFLMFAQPSTRRAVAGLALAGLALCLAGCRATAPSLAPLTLSQLKETPDGYLAGQVVDLKDHQLLNNRDFVYAIAASRVDERVAFSHLGPKTFQLGLWDMQGRGRQLADPDVNHYEFDVESVDFSPDGKVVVTASRDGGIRFFSSDKGVVLGAYLTEEPLVAVAFHPSGRYVAVGSAKGLVTVVTYPELQFAYEQRAHEGEVRAVAFTREGLFFSGGWDKSIMAFDAVEEEVTLDKARLKFERKSGLSSVRGVVNERASAELVFDSRVPYVLITSDLAKAAGMDLAFLKDSANIATPLGSTVARLAPNQTLSFKALTVRDVTIGVCDACVPAGYQGVIGSSFTDRYDISFDEVAGEVQLELKDKAGESARRKLLSLKPRKRLSFDWFVNDFSTDQSGRYLGVAFSESKAERTREVYEREKKGVPEPKREGNAGAIVDAHTGLIVRKWNTHAGIVATAGISPDGQSLATGGWDKTLQLHQPLTREPIAREFGWSVRRVRFSHDGRFLLVGAWTPQNPLGDQQSNPAALVYEVIYKSPEVMGGPSALAR